MALHVSRRKSHRDGTSGVAGPRGLWNRLPESVSSTKTSGHFKPVFTDILLVSQNLFTSYFIVLCLKFLFLFCAFLYVNMFYQRTFCIFTLIAQRLRMALLIRMLYQIRIIIVLSVSSSPSLSS